MDWTMVMKIAVLVVVCAGMGCAGYFVFRPSQDQLRNDIDEALAQADLAIGTVAFTRLERHAARRARWGALGGAGLFAVMMPGVMFALLDSTDGAAVGAVGGAVVYYGHSVGTGLSALCLRSSSPGRVRLSALQPHGLRDYLRTREIAVEVVIAIVGFAAVLAGLAMLTSSAAASSRGWLTGVLGLVIAGTVIVALLVQRRLLSEPAPASDAETLVVNDIVLAMGLDDMLTAAFSTGSMTGYLWLILIGTPWWWWVGYLAVVLVVSRVLFDPVIGPDRVPVAHRLAARSPAS